jgi:hypothetical protein
MVKAPGQAASEVVTAPRSTGQIAASVVQAAGATPSAGLDLSPGLSSDLPAGPVFTTVAGGVLTPWAYEAVAEVDPWQAEDLTPPDPRHPFAIGIDSDLIGAEPPADWVEVQPTSVEALPGESDLQVVIVDRATADCGSDVKAGLVTLEGTVVGSVLWEGPTGSSDDQTRGWAILPKANQADYSFLCPSSSSS